MKNLFKSNPILSIAFIVVFIFVGTLNVRAQENENQGKKKVRVKTVKIIDGKKVEKDTTFFVEEGDSNFTWSNQESKELNADSLFLTVDVIGESDDDSIQKKHIIIKSKENSDNENGENIFFMSDNVHFTSEMNEIKVESIEKIEVIDQTNTETNKPEKVVKVTIKTPDGKTEERIIKNSLSWSDCSAKKVIKIKKDVDITEENGVKIIKIKTIDENGNEKVEVKEIKSDQGKDLIWIEENGKKNGKVKVNVEVENDGEYKTITTTKTDEKGNKTVDVKKVKISDSEEDLDNMEKEMKTDKKKNKKEK